MTKQLLGLSVFLDRGTHTHCMGQWEHGKLNEYSEGDEMGFF